MKTDAELCAAVARALGKTPRIDSTGDQSVCQIELTHGRKKSWRIYMPDLPGADFCEVQAWVIAQGHEVRIFNDPLSVEIWGPYEHGTQYPIAAEPADTIEQALCRAVAEMAP